MSGTAPVVAGILVSRRRPVETDETLARVVAQSVPLRLLLVVNVEADSGTRRVVDSWTARHPHVEYLPVAENVGPAGAVPLGVEAVLRRCPDADFIALFEDDNPPPDEHSLVQLVGHLQRQADSERVGGVGFGGARFSWRRAVLRRPKTAERGFADVDYLTGGYVPVFRRAVFEQVGAYDPAFFFGFEELEFGLRVRAAGWRLHVIGDDKDWPQDKARGGIFLREWNWRRYYSLRNLIVILLRHRRRLTAGYVLTRSLVKPLLWLPRYRALALRYLRYNVLAIRDALTGRLGCRVPPDASP